MTLKDVRSELGKLANPVVAAQASRFFKLGKGQYGEGDIFLGLTTPQMRQVARKYHDLPLDDLAQMLHSKFHEERSCALVIMVDRYGKNKDGREDIFNLYMKSRAGINNWDLVDISAPGIVGRHLIEKDKSILHELAKSSSIWDRRIAIVSTYYFIKNNSISGTLAICEVLMSDKHDLIHKACGWMLREVGKKDAAALRKFLKKHYKEMPRTMLRYAIERFPEKERKAYLKGEI